MNPNSKSQSQYGDAGKSMFKPPQTPEDPLLQYGHEGIRGALLRLGRPSVQGPSLAHQVIQSAVHQPRGKGRY